MPTLSPKRCLQLLNNTFGRSVLMVFLSVLTSLALGATSTEITLKTVREEMRFDLKEFSVPAGGRVHLHFTNDDPLPHNVIICLPRELCSPGEPEDNGMEVAQAAWALGGDGDAMQWIPKHPRVFLASRMLKEGERQTLSFDAPARPGKYPFVCTLPGHAMLMFGTVHVQAPVPGLQDLHYTVFRSGAHRTFPDFATFRENVVSRGVLPDGLLDATPIDLNDHYAMEFTAILEIPQDGDYTFSLAGDKGTQLFIDGDLKVDHRTGHSARAIKVTKLSLTAGVKKILLRYWHQLGEDPEVSLVWSGPGFEERALSRINLVEKKRQNDGDRLAGMHLSPENGRPFFYRNYLADLSRGGFAIGFPAGANVTWDPEHLNLSTLWAGDFLDAKTHRTSRGSGTIKPSGYEVILPIVGPALVSQPAETVAPSSRFLGYQFTPSGDPIFRYRVGGVEVEESLSAEGDPRKNTLKMIRTLSLKVAEGDVSEFLLRLASSPQFQLSEQGLVILDHLRLSMDGVTPELRVTPTGAEWVAPLQIAKASSVIRLEYHWLATADRDRTSAHLSH